MFHYTAVGYYLIDAYTTVDWLSSDSAGEAREAAMLKRGADMGWILVGIFDGQLTDWSDDGG